MATVAEFRNQAETLYHRVSASSSDAEALALILRAMELERMADEVERGQVQQDATQPPTTQTKQQHQW